MINRKIYLSNAEEEGDFLSKLQKEKTTKTLTEETLCFNPYFLY